MTGSDEAHPSSREPRCRLGCRLQLGLNDRSAGWPGGRLDGRRSTFTTALVMLLVVLLVSLAAAGCGSEDEDVTTTASTTGDTTVITTDGTPTTGSGTTSDTSPGDGSATTTEPVTTTEAVTTTSDVTVTTEALSSAETRLPNGNIRGMGFIDQVWESGGTRYLSIDYAEMLSGEEARQAAIEAGVMDPGDDLPDDYFIRNVNTLKREFNVSASVVITTSTLGGVMERPATWAEFKSFWTASRPVDASHLHAMPWWIERSGDTVVKIDEQYLP